MDRGPFRAQRPAERKPAPAYRQADEPQVVSEQPAPRVAASHRAAKDSGSKKRIVVPIVAVVVVILLALGGWFAWTKLGATSSATAIDSSKYQAVFFTNGQVYFGKLHAFTDDSMKLTDIFYLQTDQPKTDADSSNPQQTSTEQSDVRLIKLGDEVHGPEDEMVIQKDQMLFYENLKSDGKVAQTIDKYNQSKK